MINMVTFKLNDLIKLASFQLDDIVKQLKERDDAYSTVQLARLFTEVRRHQKGNVTVLDIDTWRQISFIAKGYKINLRCDMRHEETNAPIYEIDIKQINDSNYRVFFRGDRVAMSHILKSIH
jgi:hypothetical protein